MMSSQRRTLRRTPNRVDEAALSVSASGIVCGAAFASDAEHPLSKHKLYLQFSTREENMTIFGRIKHSFNRITPFSEADHRNPYSHFYKSVDRKIGQRCVSAKSIQKIDEIIKRVAKNNSVEGARLMIEHQLACVSSVEKRNAVLTDHLRERLEKYRGTAKVNT